MKTIFQLFFAILFTSSIFAQNDKMSTFIIGYCGGLKPGPLENNTIVTVVDTGLVFSERFYIPYNLFAPSFTHNSEQGKPIFQWTGCHLLDAETLMPIENGDYSQSMGGESCNQNFRGESKNL